MSVFIHSVCSFKSGAAIKQKSLSTDTTLHRAVVVQKGETVVGKIKICAFHSFQENMHNLGTCTSSGFFVRVCNAKLVCRAEF